MNALWSRELGTIIRFGIVGASNTLVSALVMLVLHSAGFSYPLYSSVGYSVGIVLSFVLNRRFTFAAGQDRGFLRFLRFSVVNLVLLGLVQVWQYGLIEQAHISEMVAVGSGIALYAGLGYAASRWWVFAGRSHEAH